MQEDFHFYCIGVLARAAGFSPKDAITIAYASEYVDGATEGEPIKVGRLIFDPVRTAHNGLKAWNWGIQKKVYFPFHFIPPKPVQDEDDTYTTTQYSEFALDVFKAAADEAEPDLRLYRMGIALHTLADTWAHEGFSGIEENVNDVKGLRVEKKGKWKRVFLKRFVFELLPHIGHGQAGKYPDISHLNWKYKRGADGVVFTHQNSGRFMMAAEKIYNLLLGAAPNGQQPEASWGEIEPRIRELIHMDADLGEKCAGWKAAFNYWFRDEADYNYDEKAWRRDALGSDDVDWDKDKPAKFRKRKYEMQPGFATKPWVMFHRAAEKQRHYVMEQML